MLNAVPLKELYVAECEFPQSLVRCLNDNDIYYICDFNGYKLSQIFNMLNRKFRYDEVKKFLSLIHNEMRKYRFSYAGYVYIQQIAFHTRDEIRKIRNFGTVSQNDLEQKMIEYGIWYSDKE